MNLRTRLTVLAGATLLGASGLFGATVAGADPDDGNPSTLPFTEARCTDLVPTIVGTPGDDLLVGGYSGDVIDGRGGDDTIYGLDGHDVILGSDGNDEIHAGDGHDQVCAGQGKDEVDGGPGSDVVYGQLNDDDMRGGPGGDWLIGGAHDEGDRGDGEADIDACPTTEVTVSC